MGGLRTDESDHFSPLIEYGTAAVPPVEAEIDLEQSGTASSFGQGRFACADAVDLASADTSFDDGLMADRVNGISQF